MLVLFDIDGTLLLRASAEHAAALREALRCGLRRRRDRAAWPPRVAPTRRSHAISRRSGASMPARFDAGLDALQGEPAPSFRAALPAQPRAAPSRPGCASCSSARVARRRSLLAGHRQLRAGRAAEARARRASAITSPPARAASAPTPSCATRCRRSPALAPAAIRASGRSSSATPRWTSRAPAPTACACSPSPPGPYPAAELGDADARRRRRLGAGDAARARARAERDAQRTSRL